MVKTLLNPNYTSIGLLACVLLLLENVSMLTQKMKVINMMNIILAEHINIVVVSLLARWCSILLKASLVQPDRAANMTLFC